MEFPTTVDSSSPPPPPWIELPEDLMANILQRLDVFEILQSAEKVCTTWNRVCHNPYMWRVIHIKDAAGRCNFIQLHSMCSLAVDRSQGQLIDLSIDNFCDDELLNHIIERSPRLRCLKLKYCSFITGECLSEEVANLEHLEELHLVKLEGVDPEDVEAIGASCPRLKSFTCNDPCSSRDNDFALAIANTMPNLIHLQLVANDMNNEALEAILDGCSHLESLDIRHCIGLRLRGNLAKRCFEQIKNFKCSSDDEDSDPDDFDDDDSNSNDFHDSDDFDDGDDSNSDDFDDDDDFDDGFDNDDDDDPMSS